MHGVELYWFIMPYAHQKCILPSWQDFTSFITVGSILGYSYIRLFGSQGIHFSRPATLARVDCLTITN